MDRIRVSGTLDAGSIPAGATTTKSKCTDLQSLGFLFSGVFKQLKAQRTVAGRMQPQGALVHRRMANASALGLFCPHEMGLVASSGIVGLHPH